MIIQAYHPHVGGAERQLAALAPLLRQQNVEVHVLTRRYNNWPAFEEIDGVPVHRLPIPGPKPVASLTFSVAALPLLARLKPDVIHAHELLSPTTTAVTAKSMFGTPVVAKILRGGQLGDIAKLQNRRFGSRRLQGITKQVDRFIVISREIEAELAALGVPPQQQIFIPNGVDTARFIPPSSATRECRRAELNLPAEGPIVIFTGRLVPEKRVNQLLDVWPAVRAEHPAATLLILGTGPQESALKQQAGEGVLFCGRVDNVAPYLQAGDLYVLPSATEGLSNALLEALAVGLPVIATNVGGAPDVVEHGHGGWLIPPDQPEQLQNALVALLADSFQCRQFGQLARLRIERDYALPAVAHRLRGLYDSVLAANGRAHVEPTQLGETVPQPETAEMYPANVPDEQRSHAA